MGEKAETNSLCEDDSLFYLESTHLALKGNRDYSELIKTIVLLEVQRTKAIKDYERVVEIQEEALNDPSLFYKKVMNDSDLGLPDLQVICEIPNIDWSKYPVELPKEVLQFLNNEIVKEKTETPDPEVDIEKKLAATHQRTWSVEEQRRLEELLDIYPPEAIELRRYKKIANALGNRTVKQVSSRVQKYFLKLYKAGLPIPGRVPKNADKAKRSKLHNHQRYNHLLYKPTTFFPQLDIPVVMNEADVVPGPSNSHVESSINTSQSNYLLPSLLENSKGTKVIDDTKSYTDIQIDILKRVKLEKEKQLGNASPIEHTGFKCNYCGEEPIFGTRWHCEVCISNSIDFCSDCVVGQMYSAEPHPISHMLVPYAVETLVESSSNSESSSREDKVSNKNSSGDDSSEDSDSDNSDNIDNESNFNEKDSKSNEFQEVKVLNQSGAQTKGVNYSQYANKSVALPNLKKAILTSDNDLQMDIVNQSYSYLHSNLFLDEN